MWLFTLFLSSSHTVQHISISSVVIYQPCFILFEFYHFKQTIGLRELTEANLKLHLTAHIILNLIYINLIITMFLQYWSPRVAIPRFGKSASDMKSLRTMVLTIHSNKKTKKKFRANNKVEQQDSESNNGNSFINRQESISVSSSNAGVCDPKKKGRD